MLRSIMHLCDEEGGLIGLITDGDLRRGLLRGLSMDDSVAEVINRNPLVVLRTRTGPQSVRCACQQSGAGSQCRR